MHCKSYQIIDPPTYDQTKPDALKGENKAWQAIEEALYAPNSKASRHTKIYILRDFSSWPSKEIPQALPLLQKGLSWSDEKLRVEAQRSFWLLAQQKKRSQNEKILYKAIVKNHKKFKKLLPEEIDILGKMHLPESTVYLQELLGEDPTLDPLIIQALGKKLEEVPPPPPPMGGKQSPKENNAKENAKEKNDPENSARALMEYLSGEYPLENKKLSLKVLASSKPHLLFKVAVSSMFPVRVRVEALRLLSYIDMEPSLKKKRLHYLKKLYLYSEGNLVIKEAILKTAAAWSHSTPVEVLKKYRYEIWKKEWAKELARMRQKAYLAFLRRLRNLPKEKALVLLFTRSGLSSAEAKRLVNTMRKTTVRSLKGLDKDNFRHRVFWVALRTSLPEKNYFFLKQQATKAFSLKNFFFTVMAITNNRWQSLELRVVSLARLWNINRQQAQFLDQFFNKKQTLLAKLYL